MRLPLFTQMPRRGLLGIWGIRTCVSQTFEPVEKVVVGPVGSPKHPKTQAKTLQNRRFKPLNRGQKRARGSFSTSCFVYETLPAFLQNECAFSHLYLAPLHVVVGLISATSHQARFTL